MDIDGYMAAIESNPASRAGSLALIAGELALDFANTSSGRGSPHHLDHLREASHVLAWARHAKVLGDADMETASRVIQRDKRAASRLFDTALELRETIHAIGLALAERRPPSEADRARLAARHAEFLARAHLVPHDAGFVWSWDAKTSVTGIVLGPISFSALSLLTQQDLTRVKQCEGQHCGWLFFDTTKNKRRRWCEMSVCGNRSKVRALRARRKAQSAQGGA